METLSQIWKRIKLPIVFILLLTSIIIPIMAAYKNNPHDIMEVLQYSLFYYVLVSLCFMFIYTFIDTLIGDDCDDGILDIWFFFILGLPIILVAIGGALGVVLGIFMQALG